MFFLISGSAASGKTTVARHMAALLDRTICHDADERPAATGEQRWNNLELWVQKALEIQAGGQDFLLTTHSPLGELLTCPSATQLHGIAACVLDCDDVVRIERMRARHRSALAAQPGAAQLGLVAPHARRRPAMGAARHHR